MDFCQFSTESVFELIFWKQCYKLGVTDLEVLSAEELHTPDSFLVILNGLILGKHRRPQVLYIKARFYNKHNTHIYTSSRVSFVSVLRQFT